MKKYFRLPAFILAVALVFTCFSMPVQAQTASRYDAAREGILSEYYHVDRSQGYITGIAPGTPVSKLLNVCVPGDLNASGQTVGTGTVISNGNLSLTAIVAGDLNGDGQVNPMDRVILIRHLAEWEGYEANTFCYAAADLNGDGNVNAMDRVILVRHLASWEGYETLPKLD